MLFNLFHVIFKYMNHLEEISILKVFFNFFGRIFFPVSHKPEAFTGGVDNNDVNATLTVSIQYHTFIMSRRAVKITKHDQQNIVTNVTLTVYIEKLHCL